LLVILEDQGTKEIRGHRDVMELRGTKESGAKMDCRGKEDKQEPEDSGEELDEEEA
jgi:hypothetical protein